MSALLKMIKELDIKIMVAYTFSEEKLYKTIAEVENETASYYFTVKEKKWEGFELTKNEFEELLPYLIIQSKNILPKDEKNSILFYEYSFKK